MMLLRYWFVMERIGILLIFAFILLRVLRSAKRMVKFFDTAFGITR